MIEIFFMIVVLIGSICAILALPLIIYSLKKLHKVMKTLADLQADVTAEDQVIAGATTLLKGLADQVRALPADPAAIDALATDIEAQTANLSAAIAANTVAAPTAQ
jgi:hypothetical protein